MHNLLAIAPDGTLLEVVCLGLAFCRSKSETDGVTIGFQVEQFNQRTRGVSSAPDSVGEEVLAEQTQFPITMNSRDETNGLECGDTDGTGDVWTVQTRLVRA